MKAFLKSMTLTDFKGIRGEKTFEFYPRTSVSGMNGAGKSTLKAALNWVLLDKDDSLNGNPNIRPNDGRECLPTVNLVLDIDGREYSLTKSQKQTVKETRSGETKISTSNSYMLNSVPKTERDFKADLENVGFQMDSVEVLTNLGVFLNQKTADMRKSLFAMVGEITDEDVARKMGDSASELAAKLADYRLDEVEAMAKASKKKAGEQLESIPNMIVGLEYAIRPVDEEKLTAEKQRIEAAIEVQTAEMEQIKAASRTSIQNEIAERRTKQKIIVNALNDERTEAVRRAKQNAEQAQSALDSARFEIERIKNRCEIRANKLTEQNKRINEMLEEYKSLQNEVFPESESICPTCGQTLPEDRIEELKSRWQEKHDARLADLKSRGNTLARESAKIKEELEADNKVAGARVSEADALAVKAEDAQKAYEDAKSVPAAGGGNDKRYIALEQEIAELTHKLDEAAEVEEQRNAKRLQIEANREKLMSISEELGVARTNRETRKQIEELEASRREQAQNKADAERILYQISELNMLKNQMLSDEINRHFNIVKFELFETLKNGEIKDCCKPYVLDAASGEYRSMVDGSANTALAIAGQIDIANGLQKYNNLFLPLFIDRAESLDSDSRRRVTENVEGQVIFLGVVDNESLNITEI